MKFRKNAGAKKREKSFEISRFSAARITKRLFPPLGFMVRMFITNLKSILKIRLKAHIFPVHLPIYFLFDMIIS